MLSSFDPLKKYTLVKLSQPMKLYADILVIFEFWLNVIVCNLSQPEKEYWAIDETLAGTANDIKPELLNEYALILANLELSPNVMLFSFSSPLNANLPIWITSSGIVIVWRFTQSANAYSWISFNSWFKETIYKLLDP